MKEGERAIDNDMHSSQIKESGKTVDMRAIADTRVNRKKETRYEREGK